MVRILHLRSSNFYGGPEKQIIEHIIESNSDGWSFSVSSFDEGGQSQFLALAEERGIKSIKIANNPLHALRDLARVIEQHKINIVCSHDYKGAILLSILRVRYAVKWIAFIRGRTHEGQKIRMYQFVEDQLSCFADVVIAVSLSERRRVERAQKIRRKTRTVVIPNAVRCPSVSSEASDEARNSLVIEFGIDPEAIIFVVAGRLSVEKGQRDLLSAVSLLGGQDSMRRFVVLLCGDGPERESLKRYCSELGMSDTVRFLGHRTDMDRFLRGMDCLLLPSRSEGYPNILLEAMAYAKPSICTSVGGVPELAVADVTSIMVPSRPEAIARGIQKILRGELDLNAMGIAARRHVRQNCSFEAQAAELKKIYGSHAT